MLLRRETSKKTADCSRFNMRSQRNSMRLRAQMAKDQVLAYSMCKHENFVCVFVF